MWQVHLLRCAQRRLRGFSALFLAGLLGLVLLLLLLELLLALLLLPLLLGFVLLAPSFLLGLPLFRFFLCFSRRGGCHRGRRVCCLLLRDVRIVYRAVRVRADA